MPSVVEEAMPVAGGMLPEPLLREDCCTAGRLGPVALLHIHTFHESFLKI